MFRKCSAQCVLYFLRLSKYTVPTQLLQKGSARVHGEYFIAHTSTGLHIRHTCDTIPSPTKTARELDKRAKPLVTRGCNQKGMHTFWPCAAPFGSKTCNWSKEGVKEGVTPLLRWKGLERENFAVHRQPPSSRLCERAAAVARYLSFEGLS